MGYKKIILILSISTVFLYGQMSFGSSEHHGCDVPEAWHEWSVAGSQTVYLGHLPMFSSIHAYQIIVEVDLLRNGTSVNSLYFQDRKKNPQGDYTISPGASAAQRIDFVLPEVVRNKKTFPAYLHRSNPDGSETTIAENIQVVIKRVVYFHEFHGGERKPTELSYFIFGNSTEVMAAHLITGTLDSSQSPPSPKDFDQLLSISKIPAVNLLGKDYEIYPMVIPDRENSVDTRLKREKVKAVIYTRTGGLSILVQTDQEFHLQEKIGRQN